MNEKHTTLGDVAAIFYLTPDNAEIGEKNLFLTLKLTTTDENGAPTVKEYDRIFLHRAFPFEHPESFISVQDAEKNEIGMISELSVFPPETAERLRAELARKYYAPALTAIRQLKERYGYAYCTAMTAQGEVRFTMRDVSRNLFRVDENRLLLTDIDGNRYEIRDLHALDRKSYRQIELYL